MTKPSLEIISHLTNLGQPLKRAPRINTVALREHVMHALRA
jgi:hypothetical protein